MVNSEYVFNELYKSEKNFVRFHLKQSRRKVNGWEFIYPVHLCTFLNLA
jgi:hypothetical protein